MKFTEPSKRRPTLTHSAEVLRVESAPEENFLVSGLLNTPFVKEVRQWAALPEAELDTNQKEALLNSWWVGLLDPAYAGKLRSLPWLKQFAYTETRTLYDGTHPSYGGFRDQGHPEDMKTRKVFHQIQALESTIACLQIFPEARQELGLESTLFSVELSDKLLANAQNPTRDDRAFKALQLLQIWPNQRTKILNTLLPDDGGAWLTKIAQRANKNICETITVATALILFPELRPLVKESIATAAPNLLLETQAVTATPKRRSNAFMTSAWPLTVLAAEEAHIDANGCLQLEFKRPPLTRSIDLPPRSTL